MQTAGSEEEAKGKFEYVFVIRLFGILGVLGDLSDLGSRR